MERSLIDKSINRSGFFLKKTTIWLFLLFLLINCILSFQMKSPFLSADEGYVFAQAQYFAGDGFRQLTTAYYGYFLALIYSPLFHILNNPFDVYRGMLFINSVFASFIPVIGYIITNRYLKFDQKKSIFIAIITGLFPPVISYSKLIWNENILYIALWIIILLIVKEIMNQDNKKQKLISSFLIALVSVIAISSHNRGIEYLIAVFLAVIILPFIIKKKIVNLPVFLISAAALILLNYYLSKHIESLLWVYDKGATNTTDSFVFNLNGLLNYQAFSLFCKSFIAHLFSLFTSYFGIVCLALVACFIFFIRHFKIKNYFENDDIVLFSLSAFSLLLFLIGIVISILFYLTFMLQTMDFSKMLSSRYMDNIASILVFVGICILVSKWDSVKKYFWLSAPFFFGVVGLFILYIKPLVYNIYFSNIFQNVCMLPFINFSSIFSGESMKQLIIIASVVFIAILLLTYLQKKKLNFCIITALFVFITLSVFCNVIWFYSAYSYNSADQYKNIVQNFVKDDPKEKTNLYIASLFDFSIPYYLDYSNVLDVTDELNLNKHYDNTFYEYFNRPLGSDYFLHMYYIDSLPQINNRLQNKTLSYQSFLYVKGDTLIKYLTDNGIKLSQARPHFTYQNKFLYGTGNYKIDSNGSIIINSGGVQYGPYISLPAGKYKVTVHGKNLSESIFSVTANSGVLKIEYSPEEISDTAASFTFEIKKEMITSKDQDTLDNVECSNSNTTSIPICIDSIDLESVKN
jgi:hypothetical protein